MAHPDQIQAGQESGIGWKVSGWGPYAAAWAVFLLSHAIPVRPRV